MATNEDIQITDLVDNDRQILIVCNWLSKFKPNDKPLLLIGDYGCGKTTAIRVIARHYNYDYTDPMRASQLPIGLDSQQRLKLSKTNSHKVISVFDDLETVTSSIDREKVINVIETNKTIPIVLISNPKHNEFLQKLKKRAICVTFRQPSVDSLSRLGFSVIKKWNSRMSMTAMLRVSYISGGDIRRFIAILREFKLLFGNEKITSKSLDIYRPQGKHVSLDLFNATKRLLSNYENANSAIEQYTTDKVLLPMMVQNHYINTNDINKLSNIADSISKAYTIDAGYSFDIQKVKGFFSCVKPAFQLKGEFNQRQRLEFAIGLSKSSARRANEKVRDQISLLVTDVRYKDIMRIGVILNFLIKAKRLEECKEIIKAYGIDQDSLSKILRSCKTDFRVLTTSVKTFLFS